MVSDRPSDLLIPRSFRGSVLGSEQITTHAEPVEIPKLGRHCLGFSTADFWPALSNVSVEQKTKHFLTYEFLQALNR